MNQNSHNLIMFPCLFPESFPQLWEIIKKNPKMIKIECDNSVEKQKILLTLLPCTIFLLLSVITSCKSNPSQEAENSIVWKVDPHTKLSSYIDSVEYIVLETHPDGLFNMIEKLIVQDDKIFILDFRNRNQILVFDATGKFLFPVGALGRAPGEFLETRNFTVDSNHIYIIDNYQSRLLLYDLNGAYIETKQLPGVFYDIAILGNGDYMFNWQPLKDLPVKKENKITITDKNLNMKKELLPTNESDCCNLSKLYFFTQNDDNIVYHTLLSDTIYLFDRHDAFTLSTLTIDFTAHSIPMKWKQDYSKVTENHQYLYTTPFVTPKYILGSNDSEPYLIDRKNKKVIVNSREKDDYFLLEPEFAEGNNVFSYLLNDTYQVMIKDGMKRAPEEIEEKLEKDHYVLIKYILK